MLYKCVAPRGHLAPLALLMPRDCTTCLLCGVLLVAALAPWVPHDAQIGASACLCACLPPREQTLLPATYAGVSQPWPPCALAQLTSLCALFSACMGYMLTRVYTAAHKSVALSAAAVLYCVTLFCNKTAAQTHRSGPTYNSTRNSLPACVVSLGSYVFQT